MATYLMLTRLDPSRLEGRKSYLDLYARVREGLHADAQGIHWRHSWAVLGPYDYVDVFDAAEAEAVTRVAALIRAEAGAQVEVWPATDWEQFKALVGRNGRRVSPDPVQEAGEESFPASDPPAWS